MTTQQALSLYRSEIWHVTQNPSSIQNAENFLQVLDDGALVVDSKGKILDLADYRKLKKNYPLATIHDYRGCVILPGFIDAHLHMPQLDLIGAYGEELLGWLNRYTFPKEAMFTDKNLCKETASRLITQLFSHGTSCAVIFAASFQSSAEAMFSEAQSRGLRAIIGKVSMDRHAPKVLLQDTAADKEAQLALIKAWHGKNSRLHYALTPRFAPTCSAKMLRSLGDLKERYPNLYIQTHYAETTCEIDWVKKLFPKAKNYLDVYDEYNLLSSKTLLAHGIHTKGPERRKLLKSKSALVHCPSSNLFLGSGLFSFRDMRQQGHPIALGSDIGGGTNLSMWTTMGEAYKISALKNQIIHPVELFYYATLGAAQALSLDAEIGNFIPGKKADFQILDFRKKPFLQHRLSQASTSTEKLLALMMLADDRIVDRVFIDGQQVFRDETNNIRPAKQPK